MPIQNQKSAQCSVCKTSLDIGEGFSFKSSGKMSCKYKMCVQEVTTKEELRDYIDVMKASNARSLSFDGTVTITTDVSIEEKTLLKAMPGSVNKNKKWYVSTEPKDRKRILQLAEQLGLKIDKRFLEVTRPKETQDALNTSKKVGLYDYQLEGVEWLLDRDSSSLLGDDMGLGKTIILLMSFNINEGTFVVCPTQVITNWKKEAAKWRPDLDCQIIKSTKKFEIPGPGQIFICSYGMIPTWIAPPAGKRKNLIVTDEQKKAFKNCIVVYDECQKLANSKSQQSRKAKYFTRFCRKAIGSTGTPVRNKPLELWGVLMALGIADETFDSFMVFIRLFGGKKTRFGYEFNGTVSPEVSERLRRVMLRRLKSDPSIDVQLPQKTFIEIYNESDKSTVRSMDTAWELYQKTAEFKHGKLPDITEMSSLKKDLAIENLPKSIEIVEEYENNSTPLVFGSAHRTPVETIGKRPGWGMIIGGMTQEQKAKVVDDFQAGKLKGIAVSLLAGSAGITLTHASHLLFNDLDWVPNENEQFEDRINRIGQMAEKVFIKCITNDHPLLRHIFKLNFDKKVLAKSAIDSKIDYKFNASQEESYIEDSSALFKKRLKNAKLDEQQKVRNSVSECMPSFLDRFKNNLSNREISHTRMVQITKCAESALQDVSTIETDADLLYVLVLGGLQDDNEIRIAECLLVQNGLLEDEVKKVEKND